MWVTNLWLSSRVRKHTKIVAEPVFYMATQESLVWAHTILPTNQFPQLKLEKDQSNISMTCTGYHINFGIEHGYSTLFGFQYHRVMSSSTLWTLKANFHIGLNVVLTNLDTPYDNFLPFLVEPNNTLQYFKRMNSLKLNISNLFTRARLHKDLNFPSPHMWENEKYNTKLLTS